MLSTDLPSCSPEVICHTPSSFFSSVLAAASSPPGGRPTQRRDTPNNIARPQSLLMAYLHALNNGPDLGRPRRFSLDGAWRGSRRATVPYAIVRSLSDLKSVEEFASGCESDDPAPRGPSGMTAAFGPKTGA